MKPTVRLFVAATAISAALAVWCAGWMVSGSEPSAHWNAMAAFAVLGFLSEASYLKLRVGRAETQSSISFIPFIGSVLLFDTGWAALIVAAAVFTAEFAVKKKAPIKILFNVSQMIVSVSLASLIYQAFGGKVSLGRLDVAPLAMGAAVATYFFINSTAVSVVVALGEGVRLSEAWVRIAGASLVYDIFSSPLAPLLAYLYVRFQLPGILGLILPLYFIRHIYHVNLQLEQVNRDLLELMVKAIEARDPYTSGHSLRVSHVAEQIAKESGLGHKVVEQVRTAALLHDVGKIFEDFAPLLRKEARLDTTEKALMQTHPTRSAELVATISAFRGPIEQAVRHHHENYDGTGYPVGIAGTAIPIGARIIMIADTMDAMTTDRPYRKALTFDRVIQELGCFAGRQFDPELVDRVVKSSSIRAVVKARVAAQQDNVASGLEVHAATGRQPTRSGVMVTTQVPTP
jgi:putative nucleotidyltransferase with HDIG domain